jgi:hypothetical protein
VTQVWAPPSPRLALPVAAEAAYMLPPELRLLQFSFIYAFIPTKWDILQLTAGVTQCMYAAGHWRDGGRLAQLRGGWHGGWSLRGVRRG